MGGAWTDLRIHYCVGGAMTIRRKPAPKYKEQLEDVLSSACRHHVILETFDRERFEWEIRRAFDDGCLPPANNMNVQQDYSAYESIDLTRVLMSIPARALVNWLRDNPEGTLSKAVLTEQLRLATEHAARLELELSRTTAPVDRATIMNGELAAKLAHAQKDRFDLNQEERIDVSLSHWQRTQRNVDILITSLMIMIPLTILGGVELLWELCQWFHLL